MKKIVKGILIIAVALLIVVTAVAMYVKTALPNVGAAPDIKVNLTPERIVRGKYLANHVTACMECHSQRDWNFYAGPVKEETLGGGGQKFGKELGFPGTLYSKNISPYALHNWSDGEIFRAITCGESKDGQALFPLMGYTAFSKMTQEDAYSIIAYLRSLPPVQNAVPQRSLDFPVNFIVNTMPAKTTLTTAIPDTNNAIANGKYLVAIANCVDCHSRVDKGDIIAGSEFGGGRDFPFPNGTHNYSANITPDKETGIGIWSQDDFVRRFRVYSDASYSPKKLDENDFNTIMPWITYSGMTDKDLAAIYQYLHTLRPVKNNVQHFSKS